MRNLRSFDCKKQYQTMQGLGGVQYISEYFVLSPPIMANDKFNSIWSYNPSIALAITVAILYLIPTCILFLQTVIRYRSYFFLCVVFGSALEVGGYIARAVSTRHVDEIVRSLCLIDSHSNILATRC